VTGVATAFALNPLLGVGAVALAAGVLSGANALANKTNATAPSAPSTGAIPFASGFAAPNGTTSSVIPSTVIPTIPTTSGLSNVTTSAAAASVAANNIVSSNFNPGRFREAEARDSGTTINLTVTGAFDREGTARTIVETLNDSFYRGTGGANNLQIA
jgi:hypothetical protein